MLTVEGATGAEVMFGRFGQSVRSAVRRQDVLACETDTRAWIVARETGRAGAQALAERVAGAVRASPSWRGAPIGVTVGIAVLGEDGHDSAGLIEAAEEARFLAQASGISIARRSEPNGGDRDPAERQDVRPPPGDQRLFGVRSSRRTIETETDLNQTSVLSPRWPLWVPGKPSPPRAGTTSTGVSSTSASPTS